MTTTNSSLSRRLLMFCVLGASACTDDAAVEPPLPNAQLAAPPSAAEQTARSTATLGIDAQPRETQKRYYEALLKTRRQSAEVMQQLVTELGNEEKKATAQRSANGTNLSKQREEAQTQLSKKQQSVEELEAKLATY
jgi:hypothetical protein